MRSFVALAVSLVAAAGCARSTCEKYAEMEWRCSGYPAEQEQMTRQLAEGFCEVGKHPPSADDRDAMERFAKEGDCAARYLTSDQADCDGYQTCKDAIR